MPNWSEAEIQYLKENGPILGSEGLSNSMRFSKDACAAMMRKHGVKLDKDAHREHMRKTYGASRFYAPSEIEILKSMYETEPMAKIMAALPGRSAESINQRAMRLGLKRSPEAESAESSQSATKAWARRKAENSSVTGHSPWTESEIEILRANYGTVPVKEMPAKLPGRTSAAIAIMAGKLGLTRKKRARKDLNEE